MTNLSREYAEALFSLALEEGKKQEYYDDLFSVDSILSQNEEYLSILSNPAISKAEKIEMVTAAFSSAVCENVMSFICILCEKGNIRLMSSCAQEYKKLLDASNKVSEVVVKSSVELTFEQKRKLKEKLEKKYNTFVEIEYIVDAELLGGLIVELDGKVIDSSVRGRLQKVKDVMSK